MSISTEKVETLAHLARLSFTAEEKENMREDLEKILAMCEALKQVDTEGVEPLIYMTETHNELRQDDVIQEISHEQALKNAPKSDSDFFRVPKVIDGQ
ncbi:MAG: Asp-tRNA(Asn)/Glu-tRNA(Gln) amidotransferase subunit GatC [Bacteroidetes bacterium]|nr:Asp-tRNA(Asn)/Glu-tRNA(Gln) amidotransferase subunit GatC [Bacteroidota bacterium]MDA0943875.1 Asp-tRNA(Asn)/Glu-tRNA(Gln) amidotransferase subunit GatC [Bacteroidota bacterium]MDA1111506.1 Asp-tRNA(Asn)/Glu-tRNA(Gln) amidotransferase subunit GatC [Bacteroidota bacterium]